MQTLIVLPLQEEIALFRHAFIAHGLATADATIGRLAAVRVPDLALVEKKKAAESAARTQFGTLRKHFQQLVADCERAFNIILESLGVELKR